MADISELKFDDKNFNKHTQKGMGLLEKSLQQFGAGRSILLDKDNNIIAGNGIVEAAGAVGLDKVKIIETDGTELIAAKKRPKESWAKSLEYRKNRSNYNKRLGITVASRPKLKVVDANGNIYESILDASKQLGVNYFTLWNQIKGRRENKLGVVLYE